MANKRGGFEQERDEIVKQITIDELPKVEWLDRLYKLGVWIRGSTLPRGRLRLAAANRLPEPITPILFWLRSGPAEIQKKAALAVGEWGGRESVRELDEVLRNRKTDISTRQHCLLALQTIGGLDAVRAIIGALRQSDFEVQDSALTAIVDLVSGGSPSDIESPTNFREPLEKSQALPREENKALQDGLKKVRRQSAAPMTVRFRAEEALSYVQEVMPPKEPWWPFPFPFAKPVYDSSKMLVTAGERREGKGEDGQRIAEIVVKVLLDDGQAPDMTIEILSPRKPDLFEPVGKGFYRNKNGRLVVFLRATRYTFQKGIHALNVSIVTPDDEEIPSHESEPLSPDKESVLEFDISGPALQDWCLKPRFLLRPAGGSVRAGFLRKAQAA